MKRKISSMWRVVIVAVMVVSLGLVMAVPVSADVTVTPATGGEAISADTAADATSSAWTDLGTMTIAEGAVDDIAVQTDATLVLKAPSGFQFNSAQTPSISGVGGDITALTLTSITSSLITVTLTANAIVTMDTIIIGQTTKIQVQPTTGELPADGQIYRPTTGGGDAVIAGIIPTDEADGDLGGTATNFGILGMVHGALDAYTVVPAAGPYIAGTAFDVTITAVDQFENPLGVDYTTDEPYNWTTTASAAPDTTAPVIGTLVAGDFTDGIATKSVTLYCAELGVTFTATDNSSKTGTSDPPITVNPGAAASLVVSGITDPFIAGGTSGVTVEALDAYDNRATGYIGEIHFTSSDTRANVVLPADYTFIFGDGIKVFNGTTEGEIVRLVTKGEQTVTATDTALAYITGTQADITVQVVTRPPPRIAPPVIETNLFGEVSTFSISETGEILETITATSVDGNLTLTIPEGTIALDEDGNPLSSLTANVDPSPPPPPEDAYIIGLAYNFGPAGVTFDPPGTVAYTYDPAEIPEGVAEEDLVIAYYDEEAGEWVECECTCDPETDCVTACVCHFTCFAIIAPTPATPAAPPVPPALPAAFTSSSLSISPVEVDIGEAVSISALVTNTGEKAGSYTITLKIDGVVEETKEIALAGGTSKTVTFTTAKDKAGAYSVDVDGLMGSFMVKAAPPPPTPPTAPPPPTPPPGVNWAILGPIIAVAVFLAIFLPVRIRRRRASR